MNPENDDRILESYLEEVLGGHYPPDLTPKILQEWERRQASSGLAASLLVAPPQSADPIAPPVQLPAPRSPSISDGSPERTTTNRYAHRRSPSWWGVVVTASLLAAIGLGLWISQPRGSIDRSVAVDDGRATLPIASPRVVDSPALDSSRPGRHRDRPRGRNRIARIAVPPTTPSGGAIEAVDGAGPSPGQVALVSAPVPEPESDEAIIAYVDQALRRAWRERSVTPSPPVDDRQWCQRVYDRLLGREANEKELREFLRDREDGRRERLVDDLLASEEHAWRWTQILSSAMVETETGTAGTRDSRGDVSREALESYILESLSVDKPYDQIAYELLVATGANHPAAEDYNGAVNFLLQGSGDQGVTAADRTARVFLGKQLICSRCHDHPGNDWEQRDFWQLNAFFRQMHVIRDPSSGVARLVDRNFQGESGAGKDAEIFYRLPNGQLKIAYPGLGGHDVSHSGLLQDVNRREELAELVITSADFRRAAVNRVWSRLFGYGFTQPVDDMGPHNPPSHPEVLAKLADQFAAHAFDMDSLIRWVVLSEPFELSGKRMPESWMDAPESGGRPLFARCYAKETEPVDIYRSLMIAVNARPAIDAQPAGTFARRTWSQPSSGPLQIIETHPREGIGGPTWLERLADSTQTPKQKIHHVFLSVLSRTPDTREMTAAKLLLADRMNDSVSLPELWLLLVRQRSNF